MTDAGVSAPDPAPRVAATRSELTQALRDLRRPRDPATHVPLEQADRTVALVPTMGALHEGHLALVRRARESADVAVVSIFVNPLQFGLGEDLERYPRTLAADLRACRSEQVDLVFAPRPDVVYPEEPVVRVSAGAMGERLEGASRPGHFDGVLTVVMKLFHLVCPDVAVFGEKDAQQLAAVRRMVRDLDVPVRIESGPTVRDPDGVAVSTRNAYLSGEQRVSARALSRALRAGAAAAAGGPAAVRRSGLETLHGERGVRVDYLALVEPRTFTEVADDYAGPAVLAVAARAGSVRLIDNVPVAIPPYRTG